MVVFSVCNNLWIGVDCPLKTSTLFPSKVRMYEYKLYLKEPKKAESLLLMFCRWNGNVIKLSTRHRIECKTWNA